MVFEIRLKEFGKGSFEVRLIETDGIEVLLKEVKRFMTDYEIVKIINRSNPVNREMEIMGF